MDLYNPSSALVGRDGIVPVSPGGAKSPIALSAPSPAPEPWNTSFPQLAGVRRWHSAPPSSTRQHRWVLRNRLGSSRRGRAVPASSPRWLRVPWELLPCRDLPQGLQGNPAARPAALAPPAPRYQMPKGSTGLSPPLDCPSSARGSGQALQNHSCQPLSGF